MSNVISWSRAMELGPICLAQGNYRLLYYYYLVDIVPIDGQHFTHFPEVLVVALGYEAELWATARSLKEYTSGMSSSKDFLEECGDFANAKMQIYTIIGASLALLIGKRLIEAKGLCTIAEIAWRMALLPTPYKVDLAEIWKNVKNGDPVRKNYRHLQEFCTIDKEFANKLRLTDDPSMPFKPQRMLDPDTGRKIIKVKRPTPSSSSSSSTPQVPQNKPPRVVDVLKPYHHVAVEAYLQLHNHLHQPGGLNLGKSSPILFQPNRDHPARIIQPQEQTRTTNSLPAVHCQLQPAVQQRDKAIVADPQGQQRYFPIPPPVSTSTFVEPVRPNAILNTIWTITPADIEIFLQAGQRVAHQPPPPVVPPHLLREPEINPRVFPAASTALPPTSSPQVMISPQAAGARKSTPPPSRAQVTRVVPPRRVSAPRGAGQGISTTVSSESTETTTSTAGCSSEVVLPKYTRRVRRRLSNSTTTTTTTSTALPPTSSPQETPQAAGASTTPPPKSSPRVTVRNVPPRHFSASRVPVSSESTSWTTTSIAGSSSKVVHPKSTRRVQGRSSNSTTTTTTSKPVVAQPSVQTNPVTQSYTARRYCPSNVPPASRVKFYQGKMHWRPVNKPKPDQ